MAVSPSGFVAVTTVTDVLILDADLQKLQQYTRGFGNCDEDYPPSSVAFLDDRTVAVGAGDFTVAVARMEQRGSWRLPWTCLACAMVLFLLWVGALSIEAHRPHLFDPSLSQYIYLVESLGSKGNEHRERLEVLVSLMKRRLGTMLKVLMV
ncbi:MAG: hypothetical protein KVP17_002310 [Porospora cf. gigantea B]|nr:MAG: hypothetical protein KVP17_002310 [Porospora cf. gigantea B]